MNNIKSLNALAQNYQASKDALAGRTILVTGAGDGIGAAMAKAFAAHGATVILLGKTIAKLEAVYDAIEAAGGPQPAIYPMDLRGASEEDYEQLANSIEENFGQLDGLLHNAGILGEKKPIAQISLKSWNDVLQVNLTSNFLLTKALLPLLEKSPDASIVFTSSGVGRKSRAYWGTYAVSKFATEGLMQTLADELSNTSKIRVNSINPGATNTAMRRNAYPAEHPDTNPKAEKLAPAYLYLLGSDSQGITGQALDAQQK
jgi:NAD(P)-dependent dehydrogenase (short-subunit alcohol dehydrogenase family)